MVISEPGNDENVDRQSRLRLESESTDASFDGLEHLMPFELDDLKCFNHKGCGSINEEPENMSGLPATKMFSVAMALRKRSLGRQNSQGVEQQTRARRHWKSAFSLLQDRVDPWEKFHLDELPVENAIRYRYNALKKTWKEERVVVKMDPESFGAGAMRECFRLKKLSNFSHNQDWTRSCNNYVAKRYFDEVPRETYFADVKLQMDAKLWGEEYNRHNPPKKVDIFMMCVLEFIEREGKPLYHVEHFIEGQYVKYNSNSGFVEQSKETCRQTPHAFSHFTFERSGHELIVVDVQGVGDLYTDPQIHTIEGTEYGDGNLGAKGMALFFHSHSCNSICKSLGLAPFDLYSSESSALSDAASSFRGSDTKLRGDELVCESPSGTERHNLAKLFMKTRALSVDIAEPRAASARETRRQRTYSDYASMEEQSCHLSPHDVRDVIIEGNEKVKFHSDAGSIRSEASNHMMLLHLNHNSHQRSRRMTESSDDSGVNDVLNFQDLVNRRARPSNIEAEIDGLEFLHDESILGRVHLELAKYHEVGRFVEDGNYDKNAAYFHLKAAADCGVMTAVLDLAKMYYGLPHDTLSELEPLEELEESESRRLGFHYMEAAAKMGDRGAMVFVARALDSGLNLEHEGQRNVREAMEWYEKIAVKDEDEADVMDWGMDDPPYLILARQAEIWLDGSLKKQPDLAAELYEKAAESATTCMKGKLATKYYMLAEEAWAQCE